MIKKTTAIVAVVLFVILFTAGSVTAAYLMKSQTDVTDNTLENQYIVISATDTTDFLNEATFDTVVTGPVGSQSIEYNLHKDSDLDNVAGNDAAKISNDLTINVTPTNVTGTYNLFVSVSDFTPIGVLDYKMKVGGMIETYGATTDGRTGWLFTGLTLGANYTVELFVGDNAPVTTNPGATLGFTNYQDAQHPGSIFTFVAEIPEP